MLQHLKDRMGTWMAGVAMLAVSVSSVGAVPDVLDMAPANPAAVLVIPNLQQASDRIAEANQIVGSDLPQLNDLVGQFKQSLGLAQGVRNEGSFMLVLTDANSLQAADALPAIVMVVPVSDYAAFLDNYGGEPGEAVVQVELPRGRPAFARQVGAYALLSPRRELVAGYEAAQAGNALAQRAGVVGIKALSHHDVLLVLDMERIGPVIQPMVREATRIRAAANAPAPVYEKFVQTWTDRLVSQGQIVVMGLKVDDVTVSMSLAAQFKSDSEMGRQFTTVDDIQPILSRVPARDSIAVWAANLKSPFARQVVDSFVLAPLAEATGAAAETQLFDQNTSAIAGALFAPRELVFGQSLINAAFVVEANDPRAFARSFASYIRAMDGQRMSFDLPGSHGSFPPRVNFSTRYNANALSISGVSIDQYQVQHEIPPQLLERLGDAGPVLMLAAGSRQDGYIGTSGKYALITSRPDTQIVNELMAAAAAGGGAGDSRALRNIASRLPERSSLQAFISANGVVMTLNALGSISQMPRIQLSETNEPIAIALGTEESGMSARVVVPLSVMRYARRTADDMMGRDQPQARQQQQQQPQQRPGMPPAQQPAMHPDHRPGMGGGDGPPMHRSPSGRPMDEY